MFQTSDPYDRHKGISLAFIVRIKMEFNISFLTVVLLTLSWNSCTVESLSPGFEYDNPSDLDSEEYDSDSYYEELCDRHREYEIAGSCHLCSKICDINPASELFQDYCLNFCNGNY